MTKSENSSNKFVKYLRETSIIVIGVAVTLSAGYWISIKNEERDMKLYLNAIKIELEENYKLLEDATENFRPTHEYSEYLRAHKKDELNRDSIKIYSKIWYNAVSYTFKKNAFEMFKSSGVMRLVKDKELLLSIWNAYYELSTLEEQTDLFMKEKWMDMKKEIYAFLDDDKITDMEQKLSKIVPMYNFHIMGIDAFTMEKYEDALKCTKETLEKLEKVL